MLYFFGVSMHVDEVCLAVKFEQRPIFILEGEHPERHHEISLDRWNAVHPIFWPNMFVFYVNLYTSVEDDDFYVTINTFLLFERDIE